MLEQWRNYSNKFLNITQREQLLIGFTGLFAIVFGIFSLVIDVNLVKSKQLQKNINSLSATSRSNNAEISELQILLARNPNKALSEKIKTYEEELKAVDSQLLTLTSELINPTDMRKALLELLQLQKGVSLISFELLGVSQVVKPNGELNSEGEALPKNSVSEPPSNSQGLSLYRHGIKIKLKGQYFQLRDYLAGFEKLRWKFFWQGFHYKVQEYPNSELEVEIYSLSTRKEFVGV